MDIGLNEHHQKNVVNYLRFARFNRSQRLRGIEGAFEDLKDSRLVEDTYTLDEITEMLTGLCAVVKGEVESELINTAHTNVLLLRQVFSQAEKWHLKLQADISELENRELIEEIAKFEEREFSPAAQTSQTKMSKLSQASKLEPLNEGGAVPLLQMEINRLNDDNTKLRNRIKDLETKATGVLGEQRKLKDNLEQTQAELKAKSNQNVASDLSDLEGKMAKVKMDLKKSKESESQIAASFDEEIANAKHEILRLQAELEDTQQELTKKFNETSQYKNMKQMLTTKNEQIKDLRSRLRKYEPET
ncbi:leucine zipper transcription factor-like protein 1 [Exaiptasia diaphana]|uniref:Leucine zipper transcription factor-like protein 1 n=2 Tax=Exaiptasia diaphana TaxID=2652724 RepID=A0A913Y5W2_EXADI|nr:leucine zipper transcription factor-like protein 1 [Exaiptasia diaphana]KXJ06774.1 Leucine zipper transcription factor-like protein 1 [Exaiptasia diaphana]